MTCDDTITHLQMLAVRLKLIVLRLIAVRKLRAILVHTTTEIVFLERCS